jgi:hypothetical protein
MKMFTFIALITVAEMLFAQDLVPELAEPAAKYKTATETLEKQRLAAAAQAAQSYIATLDGIGKTATAKGDVQTAEAATTEREAALAGALPSELPAGLPALRLQGTRKALLMKLEPINADFGKRKKRLDGEYLGFLDALKQKADPESALAKRIATEKEALLANEKTAEGSGINGGVAKEIKVARGKNAVVNGDFEKVGADGKPVGWNWGEWIKLIKEKGNTFVRFDEKKMNKDGTTGYHAISQKMTVPATAQRVKIVARIRTFDVAPPTKTSCPEIMITFVDKNGNKRCRPALWPGKNGSWKEVQSEGPIPSDIVEAHFSVSSGYCPGQIDFDDVEVTFK